MHQDRFSSNYPHPFVIHLDPSISQSAGARAYKTVQYLEKRRFPGAVFSLDNGYAIRSNFEVFYGQRSVRAIAEIVSI